MSRTIICSFESTDMADRAAAKLRDNKFEVKDIEVIKNKYQNKRNVMDNSDVPYMPAANIYSGFSAIGYPADTSAFFINGTAGARFENFGNSQFFEPAMKKDVLLKLVCSESGCSKVKASLISSGATKITVQ